MLLVQKRYKEALAVLAEVGKIEPQYPLLQNRIIFAHLQLRDYTTALELAEGLVDDLPGDADAWRLLARAASGLGQRSNQGECLAGTLIWR
jgi:predicted Zn-dependent protease